MLQFCVSLLCEFHGELLTSPPEDRPVPVPVHLEPGPPPLPEELAVAIEPVAGTLYVHPRQQAEAEHRGHDTLPALDTIPDDPLREGLFRSLRHHLGTAGFTHADDPALSCPALTIRLTGYSYLHVLLILQVEARHVGPLERHTPKTIVPFLLGLLGTLEPHFRVMADHGLLAIEPDMEFGVPKPLLGDMTPRTDTYLYERHLIVSGPDREIDVASLPGREAMVSDESGRLPLTVPGGVVHHPWAAPLWRLDETPDPATIAYLLEPRTLVDAAWSLNENICTMSQALGVAMRRQGRARPARWPGRAAGRPPFSAAELRLLQLRYVILANEVGARTTYLHDWQRHLQRTVVEVDPIEPLLMRAERATSMVSTVILHSEDQHLRAHQARVERVITVLTLLTLYSVVATVAAFIRTERFPLVFQRLSSGETFFMLGLSLLVATAIAFLWRSR